MKSQVWGAFRRRAVAFSFRLLYHQLAWSYDWVSWAVSLGQWRAWQQAALPYVRGPRVLEIAHGPGHLLLDLQQAGHQPVGLDLSPQIGRLARRRLRRAGAGIPLVRARAQALPFAPASFDSVVVTFPAEFVLEAATLQAVKAALKPNGRLVIVPGARLLGHDWLTRGLVWLYRITGQGAPETPEPWAVGSLWPLSLARAGLTADIQRIALERSEVWVLIITQASHLEEPLVR